LTLTDGGTAVRMLGPLDVRIEGRAVTDELRGTQGKLCFAYLALNRDRAVPRAELEGAIWPAETPSDPGAALSTLLSRLRKALGDGVIEGRSELRLNLPDGTELDAEEVRATVDRAEELASSDPSSALEQLNAAKERLATELMARFEAPWLEDARRDLEEVR